MYFLITEEIIIMKDVQWHKYLAMLCNCNFDGVWGYFKGPEETYINIALQQTSYITSLQKPLIILPENTIHFGDKIVIKNRPFLVQEIDNISVPGISYCSLQPTTISIADKQEDKSFYIVKASQYKNTSKEERQKIGREKFNEWQLQSYSKIRIKEEYKDRKPKLLLHSCCGPCACFPLTFSSISL